MAELLKDSQLVSAIEELIDNADNFLWLISPYIKLHDRIRDKLKNAIRSKPFLQVVVLFGKNEDDVSKSINKEDIEFLKTFSHILIVYEKRLHAKFYANEDFSIVSTMNLHQFSHNNNIEIGIKLQSKKWLGKLNTLSLEEETLDYFENVINNAAVVFQKEAKEKSSLFRTEYSHSDILVDNTVQFFNQKEITLFSYKSNRSHIVSQNKSQLQSQPKVKNGYCIRTGVEIPFNPQHPMSDSAYQSWKKFNNKDYPEKYCHYSGESSNGETSLSKPILKKNWTSAKALLH